MASFFTHSNILCGWNCYWYKYWKYPPFRSNHLSVGFCCWFSVLFFFHSTIFFVFVFTANHEQERKNVYVIYNENIVHYKPLYLFIYKLNSVILRLQYADLLSRSNAVLSPSSFLLSLLRLLLFIYNNFFVFSFWIGICFCFRCNQFEFPQVHNRRENENRDGEGMLLDFFLLLFRYWLLFITLFASIWTKLLLFMSVSFFLHTYSFAQLII